MSKKYGEDCENRNRRNYEKNVLHHGHCDNIILDNVMTVRYDAQNQNMKNLPYYLERIISNVKDSVNIWNNLGERCNFIAENSKSEKEIKKGNKKAYEECKNKIIEIKKELVNWDGCDKRERKEIISSLKDELDNLKNGSSKHIDKTEDYKKFIEKTKETLDKLKEREKQESKSNEAKRNFGEEIKEGVYVDENKAIEKLLEKEQTVHIEKSK